MRKIIFDSSMIEELRTFLEVQHHTMEEAANHFGVSGDTIRRLRYENNIHSGTLNKEHHEGAIHDIDPLREKEVVVLFSATNARMKDIQKETKLPDYVIQKILRDHFSEEEIKTRKSKLYSKSKTADKNPMYGKRGDQTNNWKGGVVSDGNGYLIVKKPDWYTGRARSDYIFYHTAVMCEALGITEIPKGFSIHHIDHNPLNNDISNLALVSMGAHTRLHAIEKRMMLQGSETIRNGVGTDGAEMPDLNRSR